MSAHRSCAEALRFVETSDLPHVTKRDLKSAIITVVRQWMGKDIGTTPADLALFQSEFRTWNGARFGITEQTFSKVLSQFRRALRMVNGASTLPPPRDPRWDSLKAGLDERWASRENGSDWDRMRLRRFMNWCATNGIAPDEVSDQTVSDYSEAGYQGLSRGERSAREHRLRTVWNRAVNELPDWPKTTISMECESARPRASLPADAFPAKFVAQVNEYCANGGFLNRRDVFDAQKGDLLEQVLARHAAGHAAQRPRLTSRRQKPLAEATINNHRHAIFVCATALVTSGRKRIEEIQSIADVVSDEGIAATADQIAKRRASNGSASGHAAQTAKTLISIADRCAIPLGKRQVRTMKDLAQALADTADTPNGFMSQKNAARVAQFDDPRAFERLLAAPQIVIDELEQERRATGIVSVKAAESAATATAILIETLLPVRRRTITLTKLSNFRPPATRGGNATLSYETWQTKTGTPDGRILSPEHWQLIEVYLRTYRPLMPGAMGSEFLFPGFKGEGHIAPPTLASRVDVMVKARTGHKMTLHNFRHLMATKLTDAGKIAGAAALLGHADDTRAKLNYIRSRTRGAALQLDELTRDARERGVRLERMRKAKQAVLARKVS